MCWFLCDADAITCVLLVWGLWVSVEEKIAICITDIETFQTFPGSKPGDCEAVQCVVV